MARNCKITLQIDTGTRRPQVVGAFDQVSHEEL